MARARSDPELHRQVPGRGLLTAEDIAAIEQAVATEVADAVAYAEAGTLESVDDLTATS